MNKCLKQNTRLAASLLSEGHPLVFEYLFEATVPF